MAEWTEIKAGGQAHNWKKGDVAEGILKQVREKVGPNESNIYVIGDDEYWGTAALDILMQNVKVGSTVRIACTDDQYKFPNGRVGRNFKVEVAE